MTHVVALSGGKDSTAMALRLAEVAPRDYRYVMQAVMVSGVDALEHAVTASWRAWLSDGGKCCCDRCVRDAQGRPR